MEGNLDFGDLFSVPLFRQKLSLNNEEIESHCLHLMQKSPGVEKTNSGGWQSEAFTQPPDFLEPLFNNISRAASAAAAAVDMPDVQFCNGWINVNGHKDFNWPHTHIPAILSGVYYVKVPENGGHLKFYHPALVDHGWGNSPHSNKYNSSRWPVESKTGLLYLFPGWVKHLVYPNLNESEARISISFNFI